MRAAAQTQPVQCLVAVVTFMKSYKLRVLESECLEIENATSNKAMNQKPQ